MTTGDDSGALLDAAFASHREAALALAHRILGDAHLAEDAVQQAFLQILVRVRRGDERLLGGNQRAVVLKGTRWASLKLAERDRDRHAGTDFDADADSSVDPWARSEARLLVNDILPELPVHYRDALRLRYLEARPDAAGASTVSVTLKAYRRRIDRALSLARKTAERRGFDSAGAWLPQLTGRTPGWLRQMATRADAAMRRARLRAPSGGGWSNVGHVAIALAVVSLTAGPASAFAATRRGSGDGASAALGPMRGRDVVRPRPTTVNGSAAVVDHQAQVVSGGAGPGPQPLPVPSFGLLPDPSANSVPPEQTFMFQVTAAPHFEQTHALVAMGEGYACQCWIVYRSLDGGATWASAPLATTTGTVAPTLVLPPDYPRDPRVFEGFNFSMTGIDCVLATFDAPTCTPIPLSGPLQLDAAFDAGFPVAYAAEPDVGVVAYDLGSHLSHVLMVSDSDFPQPIAAPAAIGPVALYMRGPNYDLLGPRDSGNDVFTCDRSFQCVVRNPADTGFDILKTDRLDSTTRLLLSSTSGFETDTILISRDAGSTYTRHSPPGQFVSQWALVGPAPDPLIVALVEPAHLPAVWPIYWQQAGDPGWHALAMPPVSQSESLMSVITADRIIISATGDAGYWCTADRGRTWAHRCPALTG